MVRVSIMIGIDGGGGGLVASRARANAREQGRVHTLESERASSYEGNDKACFCLSRNCITSAVESLDFDEDRRSMTTSQRDAQEWNGSPE